MLSENWPPFYNLLYQTELGGCHSQFSPAFPTKTGISHRFPTPMHYCKRCKFPQKLTIDLHNLPLQQKWVPCNDPLGFHFSHAKAMPKLTVTNRYDFPRSTSLGMFAAVRGAAFFLRQTQKIDPSFVCFVLLKDGKIQRMPHPL